MNDNIAPNTASNFVDEYKKRILTAVNYNGTDDHEDLITILKEIDSNKTLSELILQTRIQKDAEIFQLEKTN